jgi:hypothetical protein
MFSLERYGSSGDCASIVRCTLETVVGELVKSCDLLLLDVCLLVFGLASSGACSGSNSQVGSVQSVASVKGAKFSVRVSLKYVGDGSVTRKGDVTLELAFDEVGQMLGSKCPIVRGAAMFGGAQLVQYAVGGAVQCAPGLEDTACGKLCLKAGWSGNMTAVLEALPAVVEIRVDDSGGNVALALDNPAPMANIDIPGFVEKQAVRLGDSFGLAIVTRPPLAASSIAIADQGVGFSEGSYGNLIQGAVYSDLVIRSGGTPSGSWVAAIEAVNPATSAGEATLQFSYGRRTAFHTCPALAECSGWTDIDWRRSEVSYSL